MGTADNRVDLLYGTLDLLILRTLVYGPSHGHAIAKHIQRVSERRPPGGNRLAVPRLAPTGRAGLDRGGMEEIRQG